MFEIVQSLSRAYGKQRAVSFNMRDRWPTKMRRVLWCMLFTAKAIRVGIKSMRTEAIGERVIYEGRPCSIVNWAGHSLPTLAGPGFYHENCEREKIITVGGFQKYAHRFRVGFVWYLQSWFDIDVQRRLERMQLTTQAP